MIRRQHPAVNAIFLTREDETRHSPVVLWPAVFEKYRYEIRAPVLMVWGRASRRQRVMNIVAARVQGIEQPPTPCRHRGVGSRLERTALQDGRYAPDSSRPAFKPKSTLSELPNIYGLG